MITVNITYNALRRLGRLAAILAVFAIGVAGTIYDAEFMVRIAFGSLVLLALMRYPYILLLTWIVLGSLVGSPIPLFNGNNFLSGMTIPTLLLLLFIPVKSAFKRMPILPFLLIYLIWVFLSIGISPIGVTQFLTQWLVQIGCLAICVIMIFLLTTRRSMMGIIDALLLLAMFVAVYGIYGYFTLENGLFDNSIAGLYRIGSVFAAPPTLAFFLSLFIPLALYRTITLRGFKQVICIIFMLTFVVAFALTFTRVPMLSLPCSIIVMAIFVPSARLRGWLLGGMAGLGIVAIVVANILNIPLLDRFLSSDTATLNGRVYLWDALFDHFDPGQLLGYGLNASSVLLENLQVSIGASVIDTGSHNIFIKAIYDHGIIGATLLAVVLIVIPIVLIGRMRKTTAEHRLLLAAVMAIYANVVMQSMFVTVIWSSQVNPFVWMTLALPFVQYWKKHEEAALHGKAAPPEEETLPTRQAQDTKQEQNTYV